ncbi:MAG: EamA/RhaT family transporter [Verrucomicrobiota bacterium]
MNFPSHLLLPLASGFGYVVAVMLVKGSARHGVGLWRTTFVSNVAMGVCFAPFWLLGGAAGGWGDWWRPAVAAAAFFMGQVLTFMALAGEVSVATPVLGLKIILVALLSTLLLAGDVPPVWWAAAALSTVAIALLNRPVGGASGHGRVGRTVALAAGAAAAFALSDVLVQRWAPLTGAGRFLPMMFALLAVFSFALVPRFNAPLRAMPRAAWPWLLAGAVLLALQAAGMAWTLATHGDATAANVVYSSRGLWSVLLVWLVGHWFGNTEGRLPAAVLRRRLGGAALMIAAIGLVLTS